MLTLSAFLPFAIFFFYQNNGGRAPPLDPPPVHNVYQKNVFIISPNYLQSDPFKRPPSRNGHCPNLAYDLRCTIGHLHDNITLAAEQVALWDFQNKGRSRWTGSSCFVLEVSLCHLVTSMCDFVPCDRIV